MSSAWIGLMGALIGGAIGVIAQIVARQFEARQQHAQWLRQRRAEAYRTFLLSAAERFDALYAYNNYRSYDEPDRVWLKAILNDAANVDLFGSAEARRLVTQVTRGLATYGNASVDERDNAQDNAWRAVDAFREQARNDLISVSGRPMPAVFVSAGRAVSSWSQRVSKPRRAA